MMIVAWLVAGACLLALCFVLARQRKLQRALRTLEQGVERERAALAREQLLRTLLDASPAAIVFYSDNGRIVFANAPARELFLEGGEAEGKNFLQLVAQGPAAFRPALLAQGDQVTSFEIEGGREAYQFARRVFPHAGGLHTLLVVRHVTREIARQELEVLKRVVRLLTHEVNNALAPVSSLMHSARQIVRTGERLERLEKVFTTVDERVRHLSQFIAGYAALARLPPPTPSEQPWEPLIARLRVLYPEVQMNVDSSARGLFDAGQMEQALINLLKNACEAGGPVEAVTLELRALGDLSEVEVLDRGTGFSSEALDHAVLPFFTTKPGGSGVGLALVREIVEAHGGQLRLGAREGGGAAVSLRIPSRAQATIDLKSRAKLTLSRV